MNARSYDYSFNFMQGQSMPEAHLPANDDDHFFKTVFPAWEREKGFQHVKGTVVCATTEYRRVPEPAADSLPRQTTLIPQGTPLNA